MIVEDKIKLIYKENVNYKMSFVDFIFENISLQQRKTNNLLRYLEHKYRAINRLDHLITVDPKPNNKDLVSVRVKSILVEKLILSKWHTPFGLIMNSTHKGLKSKSLKHKSL